MENPVVLHVDDDPEFVELTASVLGRHEGSFEVLTETEPTNVPERLATADVDCVVSDYQMPQLDGLELCETVRAEHPDLPFILFTGEGSETVAGEAISRGVTDYVQKGPGTDQFTVLTNRIRNAIDAARSRAVAERTERRLSELAANTDDVLYLFSADWSELLFVNSAYEEIWGRSIEDLEATPESFVEEVVPADRERVREAMAQVSRGEPVTVEYRLRDGDERWVESRANPVFEDGEVVRIAGFAREITARKQRERELRRERRFIDEALDTLDDIFFVFSPSGELLRWNTQVSAVTGYDEETIAGMSPTEFFPEEAHDRVATAVERAFAEGSARVEAPLQTADGERVPHEFVGHRLTDPEGNVTGLAGIGRDVSERKAREQRLERTNERLDEFAGVVSHDLRNPLNVASGELALLREECDSDRIEAIADAHDRMRRLIDDILAIAREGERAAETEPVDLGSVVAAAWETVGTPEATLVTDLTATVRADRHGLRQLLENLLRNAVEHGSTRPGSHTQGDAVESGPASEGSQAHETVERGSTRPDPGTDTTGQAARPSVTDGAGGTTAVTVEVSDLDDGFYVADDGPGIPADERGRVFEPGYSTAPDGTGFGLRIVEQIAETHGWTVRATGSETGGARFEITGIDRGA